MLKCKQCEKEWHNGLIVETPDRESLYFCDWYCITQYAILITSAKYRNPDANIRRP